MIRFFTLIILITITTSIYAQTTVSGEQSGTWNLEGSPYQVIDNLTIPSGQSLTIEAGVEVNFQNHYKFYVNGNLQAIGADADSIFFTADNHTVGWAGIILETSEMCNFSYCKFEYGKTATSDEYPDMSGGAVRMLNSDAVYNNCIFINNSCLASEGMGGAIYAINTGSASNPITKFTSCKFINNIGFSEGGAIKFTSDYNTEITNCEFRNNTTSYGGGAICFYSVVDTKVINCLFSGNTSNYDNGGAIKSLGVADNTIFFKNTTFTENTAPGGSGGAAALYYATVDFVNCIAYNNNSAYDDDNIYIDAGGSSATINYSNLVMPEYNTTGANNINENPLFVDATNGDYHLQETSSCIDAGTDIGLPYFGIAPDMGCYEYDATSINNINTEDITIFPNPTNGNIHIIGLEKTSNIKITNVIGKIVKEFTNNNNINISELNSGIYFINIKNGNKIFIQKIIKD